MQVKTATDADVDQIRSLIDLAINLLQIPYLTTDQIAASHKAMGLDRQLIKDGTYYCVWEDGRIIGCGGWSYRSTLSGGDHSAGRDAARLNPAKDRARIRAMYTNPDFTRRGIGRLVLETSEAAAKAAGFKALGMAATLAGEPFYARCGYVVERRWQDENGAVPCLLYTSPSPRD